MSQCADLWSHLKSHPLGVGGSIFAGLTRLIPHPPNVTSLDAFGMYSGARLSLLASILTSFSTMVITDLILGGLQMNASWNQSHTYEAFGSWTPFVYGSLLVNILIGRFFLTSSESPLLVGCASLLASTQFFIVSNFGVWITGGGVLYSLTFTGLMACYLAALPFFWTQILGDIAYSAIFFSAHSVLSKREAFRSESVELAAVHDNEHLTLLVDKTSDADIAEKH